MKVDIFNEIRQMITKLSPDDTINLEPYRKELVMLNRELNKKLSETAETKIDYEAVKSYVNIIVTQAVNQEQIQRIPNGLKDKCRSKLAKNIIRSALAEHKLDSTKYWDNKLLKQVVHIVSSSTSIQELRNSLRLFSSTVEHLSREESLDQEVKILAETIDMYDTKLKDFEYYKYQNEQLILGMTENDEELSHYLNIQSLKKEGKTNKEIATVLGLTERKVKYLMKKYS